MIKRVIAQASKRTLTNVGRISPIRLPHLLNATANYVYTGGWMKSHDFDVSRTVRHRFDVFEAMAAELGDDRVVYLEFGVFQGEATRKWSSLLRNPDSELIGFDSFEGLPEAWNSYNPVSEFSTGGVAPTIDDPRVRFVVGYFEDTLPDFVVPTGGRLVLNLDADLYSSTSYVLDQLQEHITVGTQIYFDEFCDRLHELRAFDEFIEKTGMEFEVVSTTADMAHVAFRRIA